MEEENLREIVIAQRKWYKNLSKKLKKDCQIKRAVESAEIHNYIVCMRIFKISKEELSEYYHKIKNNNLIDETNNIIVELTNNDKKLHQIIMQRQMKEGVKFSDVQLAIAGLM